MVETAEFAHGIIKSAFSGVAERRMAEIMRQSNRLAEAFVEIEAVAQGAGDLSNFDAVGQPGAVIFTFVIGKNLRFAI